MDDIKVYLRDMQSGEWISYAPEDWLKQYYARVEDALVVHQGTFGGSIGLTGTPERGRLTVCDAGDKVVLDFDWHTMTVETARRSGR